MGVTWRVSDCEELVGVDHRRRRDCFNDHLPLPGPLVSNTLNRPAKKFPKHEMTDSQSGPNTPEREVVDLLAGAHASVGEGHAPRFGRDRRVGRGRPIAQGYC